MRSPFHAQVWELWRTSRVEIGMRLGALFCFLLLFVLLGSSLGENENRVLRSIFVMVAVISSVGTAAWASELDKQQFGFRFRLGFTRPISTWQLVTVPIVFTVAVSTVSYWISAGLYGLAMGVSVPMLGPATLLATLVTCFFAVVWSPSNRTGKWIAVVLFGLMVVAFCAHSHRVNQTSEPFLMTLGSQSYWELSWSSFLLAMGICSFALGSTMVAVARQRRGDPVGLSLRWGRAITKNRRCSRSISPLHNSFWAQCWYESRRVLPAVMMVSLMGSLITLLILVLLSRFHASWQSTPLVWSIVLFTSPIVYQLVSVENALGLKSKNGIVKLSVFDATRAMRCDQLIGIKLLVVAYAVFLAWLLTLILASCHLAVLGQLPVGWGNIMDSVATLDLPSGWWFFVVISLVFSYVNVTCILLVVGMLLPTRPKLFAILGAVGGLHLLLSLWDWKRGWQWVPFWTVEGYLVALGLVLFAVVVIRRSLASRVIDARWFGVLAVMWAMYATSTFWLGATVKIALPFSISTLHIAMAGAGLLMSLACVVIAPLALASFRHR